jgi:hypothetical protein
MKSVRFSEIDGYKVVYGVLHQSIDPEETRSAIANELKIPLDDVVEQENLDQLIEQYGIYHKPEPGELYVTDEKGSEIDAQFQALKEHELLTLKDEAIPKCEIIPDWKGTKYHLKIDDIWAEGEITVIGTSMPEGSILPDDLTEAQRKEITEQKESARVAALEPEEREKELKARLIALADEADYLSRRAHIQGEEFDPVVWYQEHKAPIEAKYA